MMTSGFSLALDFFSVAAGAAAGALVLGAAFAAFAGAAAALPFGVSLVEDLAVEEAFVAAFFTIGDLG